MKGILFGLAAAAAVVVSSPARAEIAEIFDARALQNAAMIEARVAGLNWKVGDTNEYVMEVGGFIRGTAVMAVVQDTGDAFWLNQDMDLGFAGKHKAEVLLQKADGKILKFILDGKEQTPPDAGDMEVVEMKESQVQVPAGSFKCVYAKLRSKKDGNEQEAWLNPQEIPMSGLLKSLSDSQLGKAKQELKAYRHGA